MPFRRPQFCNNKIRKQIFPTAVPRSHGLGRAYISREMIQTNNKARPNNKEEDARVKQSLLC